MLKLLRNVLFCKSYGFRSYFMLQNVLPAVIRFVTMLCFVVNVIQHILIQRDYVKFNTHRDFPKRLPPKLFLYAVCVILVRQDN